MRNKKKSNRALLDDCIKKAILRTDREIESDGGSIDKLIGCISSLDKLIDRGGDGGEGAPVTGVVYLPPIEPDEGRKTGG